MVQPWKGCVGATPPGVRIPPSPPSDEKAANLVRLFCFRTNLAVAREKWYNTHIMREGCKYGITD